MSKEKVYGVVRTGGNKKAIVYRAESYDMLDLPEGFMSKREAKALLQNLAIKLLVLQDLPTPYLK